MKVLGIDPGTATVGYGVVERLRDASRLLRLVECGIIRTGPRDSLSRRLQIIHEGLTELLQRHRPDVLAVEGIFYATNVRTTVVLGHARGVILLAGAEAGVIVTEYSPALVKKTVVGRGAALKPQVGYMVAKLLKLEAPPRPADAADAVAVALTHFFTVTRPGAGR
jgi:crossover junction endodeoxyribonuclease RuvC